MGVSAAVIAAAVVGTSYQAYQNKEAKKDANEERGQQQSRLMAEEARQAEASKVADLRAGQRARRVRQLAMNSGLGQGNRDSLLGGVTAPNVLGSATGKSSLGL